jgi:hypothetical protein
VAIGDVVFTCITSALTPVAVANPLRERCLETRVADGWIEVRKREVSE